MQENGWRESLLFHLADLLQISMVSCGFSLKPTQWNRGISASHSFFHVSSPKACTWITWLILDTLWHISRLSAKKRKQIPVVIIIKIAIICIVYIYIYLSLSLHRLQTRSAENMFIVQASALVCELKPFVEPFEPGLARSSGSASCTMATVASMVGMGCLDTMDHYG